MGRVNFNFGNCGPGSRGWKSCPYLLDVINGWPAKKLTNETLNGNFDVILLKISQ